MSQNNRLSPLDLLNQSNQEFMAAFENGNAAKIAQLYTVQGQLFPANAETIRGRETIRAFWQQAMDQGVKSAKLKTVEIECLEDTLIQVGRYILCGSNDQILDMGKYLVV
jgi:ketosteroid isomerase-like protein